MLHDLLYHPSSGGVRQVVCYHSQRSNVHRGRRCFPLSQTSLSYFPAFNPPPHCMAKFFHLKILHLGVKYAFLSFDMQIKICTFGIPILQTNGLQSTLLGYHIAFLHFSSNLIQFMCSYNINIVNINAIIMATHCTVSAPLHQTPRR